MELDLKEYMKSVYHLESSIFEQNKILDELNSEIRIYRKELGILEAEYNEDGTLDEVGTMANMVLSDETPYRRKLNRSSLPRLGSYFDSDYFIMLFVIVTLITTLLLILKFFNDGFFATINYLFDDFDQILIYNFICIGIYTFYKFYKFSSDTNRIRISNEKIDKENQILEKYNQDKLNIRNAQMANMEEEVKFLKERLIESNNLLNNLYDLNVLYPKYRNFIAVSSIYEYLSSGRCNTLEGYDGAYNIFEQDMKMNLIINKMDDILINLKQIKQNQYMLYNILQKINTDIAYIKEDFHQIRIQNESILENNSVIAYNSKITAQNSEIFKYYLLLSKRS